jgi:hypothetical protein
MDYEPFRRPNQVLDKLVAAGIELVYARDSELAAALDVSPPSLEGSDDRALAQIRSTQGRGITYRAARKLYRNLKDNKQLRPLLERVRHEILTRT